MNPTPNSMKAAATPRIQIACRRLKASWSAPGMRYAWELLATWRAVWKSAKQKGPL